MATSPLGPPLAYAASNASGTVSILDAGTLTISTPAAPLAAPAGVTLTPDNVYLYVANSGGNTVSVVQRNLFAVTNTIGVGETPFGIQVSPNGLFVYVANQASDTVSVISTAPRTVVATIPVGSSPTWVVAAPNDLEVYVTNQGGDSVSVISTVTHTVVATVIGLSAPYGAAITSDSRYLYVANSTANTVSVIDTVSRAITATIPVGTAPWGVTVTPDNSHVYVANHGSDTVSYIDTATNTVSSTVAVGHQPTGVGVAASGLAAFVSNSGANTVTVLALINMIRPSAGPEAGGNIVTVTGTNLSNATAVRFSEVPGTIMANTVSQILVVPPPGVGVAQLTVTTAGGTSNAKPYVYAPGGELVALSPEAGPTAGRNIISIEGHRFSTATQVRFGSVPAVPTVVSDQLITVTVPPADGPGRVPVTVTTAGGPTTDSITYAYIDPPLLSAVSPNTGPVPGGNVINLYGLNLSTTSMVTFNNALVQYSVQSDTVLTVVVPPNPAPGAADIALTTDSGTTALSGAYLYV
ncbi:IPT/TIG domain-containing protein [Streptomyces sodiiphilus]|uniref:IPT/TIG domain-containing protein n=1 Tax=Streptomyces sodiiphilus TaxID=226217 RepID=UPI0031CE9B6F